MCQSKEIASARRDALDEVRVGDRLGRRLARQLGVENINVWLVELTAKALEKIVARYLTPLRVGTERLPNVEGCVAHQIGLLQVFLGDRVEYVGPGFAVELVGLSVKALRIGKLAFQVLGFLRGKLSQDLLGLRHENFTKIAKFEHTGHHQAIKRPHFFGAYLDDLGQKVGQLLLAQLTRGVFVHHTEGVNSVEIVTIADQALSQQLQRNFILCDQFEKLVN